MFEDLRRITVFADLAEEHLMALGRLSAGLAHELNSPAAAVRRSARERGWGWTS